MPASAVCLPSIRPITGRAATWPAPAAALCAAAALLAGLCAGTAHADEPVAPAPYWTDDLRYLVGLSLSSSPTYAGSASHKLTVKPLWAARLGRWRLSTGGVGSLLASAADVGPGATTDLFRGQRLSASLGLRADGGRASSDDPALDGLAPVRRTVRLRLGLRYQLTPDWSADMTVSEDLLGKGGGLATGLGLGTGGAWSEATRWRAGVGLSLGDAAYLRARFGVPEAAARAGRPAFTPGGGLQDVFVGAGTTTVLSPRWVLLTQLGVSQMLGDPAHSPLTRQRNGVAGGVSLVWRSKP